MSSEVYMRPHVHEHVTRFLIGLVVIGMVFIPATNLSARTVRVGARTARAQSFVPAGTSAAIVVQFQKDMAPIIDHAARGVLTSTDYASMKASLGMVFANWNESGFTKNLQAYVLSHRDLILEGPTGAQVHAAWLQVRASLPRTSLLTEGEYADSLLRSTREDRARFLNMVQSQGLEKFQEGILQELQGLSDMAARHALRPGIVLTGCNNNVAFYAGAASTYLGIVAIAAAATGPVAGGIAIVSAALGLVSLIASC